MNGIKFRFQTSTRVRDLSCIALVLRPVLISMVITRKYRPSTSSQALLARCSTSTLHVLHRTEIRDVMRLNKKKTPPRRLCDCSCLSVCLRVGSATRKPHRWISMKFSKRIAFGDKHNATNFSDLGMIRRIVTGIVAGSRGVG